MTAVHVYWSNHVGLLGIDAMASPSPWSPDKTSKSGSRPDESSGQVGANRVMESVVASAPTASSSSDLLALM